MYMSMGSDDYRLMMRMDVRQEKGAKALRVLPFLDGYSGGKSGDQPNENQNKNLNYGWLCFHAPKQHHRCRGTRQGDPALAQPFRSHFGSSRFS